MIVLTGSDLSTGSFMYATLAFIHGRISIFKMLQHWTLTFFGNLAGSLFMVAIIFGCMLLPPFRASLITFVITFSIVYDGALLTTFAYRLRILQSSSLRGHAMIEQRALANMIQMVVYLTLETT